MDRAMRFEQTMRLIFGKRAYQIASSEANLKHRKEWVQKAIRQLLRRVDQLDTTLQHKQMLMAELEATSIMLKDSKEDLWAIIYSLFRFSMRLLGFHSGAQCYTSIYWQTKAQYYTEHLNRGGDALQDFTDGRDAISVRRSLVKDMQAKNLSNFKIALVLNTTEYEVKRLSAQK